MTARQKLEDKGLNLNTLFLITGGVVTIAGGGWVVAKFLVPLESVPAEVADLRRNQIVQTEALKTLAEVASDQKQTRADVIRHDAELRETRRRLEWLEKR